MAGLRGDSQLTVTAQKTPECHSEMVGINGDVWILIETLFLSFSQSLLLLGFSHPYFYPKEVCKSMGHIVPQTYFPSKRKSGISLDGHRMLFWKVHWAVVLSLKKEGLPHFIGFSLHSGPGQKSQGFSPLHFTFWPTECMTLSPNVW